MKLESIQKNGETFVLVPQGMFDELMEEAEMREDVRAYDEAKQRITEYFPAEVVNRLIEGEHPVKVYREYRGLTQQLLAKKAGIGRAYLAMIETGRKNGSMATCKKLAIALRVDLDAIA